MSRIPGLLLRFIPPCAFQTSSTPGSTDQAPLPSPQSLNSSVLHCSSPQDRHVLLSPTVKMKHTCDHWAPSISILPPLPCNQVSWTYDSSGDLPFLSTYALTEATSDPWLPAALSLFIWVSSVCVLWTIPFMTHCLNKA